MRPPLEGIRILDLSRLAPGPYATMLLADMGADVVKVEEVGPPTGRRAEQGGGRAGFLPQDRRSVAYNALNRNKRSIRLNLKDPAGLEIFYRLAAETDVVVEEFRPDVKHRLKIDYETIAAINPSVIYCSVTGYGQDGPYRDLAGHDINYISFAGALGLIGTPEHGPVIPLNLIADFAAGGQQAALAITMALFARERTGKGQYIDCAMLDGVISLLAWFYSDHFNTGNTMPLGSSWVQGSTPFYQVYECADGKWISLGSLESWFFVSLCRALHLEEFVDDAWVPERWPSMFEAFRTTFRRKNRDDWFEVLAKADVCVGKVLSLDEVAEDPHVHARQMIVDLPHPEFGHVRQVGLPMKLSRTPGVVKRCAPQPGEHTEEILVGAGYSLETIASLCASGTVGKES